MDSSFKKKCKELKKMTQYDDDSIVIKSPIMNDPMKYPCIKEQNLSFKCLIDNDHDKEKCKESFENYKICQQFWNKIYWDRYSRNIKPYLPLPEDRPKIQEEYFEKLRKLAKGEEDIPNFWMSETAKK